MSDEVLEVTTFMMKLEKYTFAKKLNQIRKLSNMAQPEAFSSHLGGTFECSKTYCRSTL